MRAIGRRIFGVLLVVSPLAGLISADRGWAQSEVVEESYLVAVNDAPPYRIIRHIEGRTVFTGFYIDVAREMAQRLGIRLNFVELSFRRALSMMQSGEADIMLGPNRTPERETFMVYIEEALPSESKSFFLRRESADISDYDDLSGKLVGVLRGATYFDRFDSDTSIEKFEVSDYLGALKMVASGRLDTVIAPTLLGEYMIGRYGLPVRTGTLTIDGRPSYITMSRASVVTKRLDDFAGTLAEMKADGTLARIEARYR